MNYYLNLFYTGHQNHSSDLMDSDSLSQTRPKKHKTTSAIMSQTLNERMPVFI